MPSKPQHPELYQPAGIFMVRAPLLPAATLTDLLAGPTSRGISPSGTVVPRDRQRAEARRRLRELAEDPRVRQALQVASPSLVESLGRPGDRKATDRADGALLRYLTRMATRPTPYGLFAGVALGSFEQTTSLQLGEDPVLRTRTRADSGWLAELVNQLEQDDALRNHLPVRVDGLVRVLAHRVVLDPSAGNSRRTQRVSVRLTTPVRLALELAATGPGYGELVVALAGQLPAAGESRIRALVGQLWDLGIITSALNAPPGEARPERRLLTHLRGRPELAPVVQALETICTDAAVVDAGRGRAPADALRTMSDRQRAMLTKHDGPTYQLDTALALAGRGLSATIGTAVAESAEVLVRTGSTSRPAHVTQYHQAFLEHYGANSLVPILDVLSAENGLDAPDTYLSPARAVPLPAVPEPSHPERERRLTGLVLQVVRQGGTSLELTDELVEELSVRRPGHAQRPARPSLDLYCRVAASSRAAIDAGDWTVVLSPGTFNGLQSFGRFFDVLEADDVLRTVAAAEEKLRPDLVFAELNAAEPMLRGQNLTNHPAVRAYEICLNVPPTLPAEQQLTLSDLRLGADGDSFYLWSDSLGRQVVVTQTHALIQTQAPNVCRALLEFSQDCFAGQPYFDWGPLTGAPFRPRLTRGRAVLSLAEWTLRAEQLDAAADPDAFYAAVQTWCKDWGVPRHVYLTDSDNRLLLDLEHPLWVDELQRAVRALGNKHGPSFVRLQEAFPAPSDLWLTDQLGSAYHCELVVPVLATGTPNQPARKASAAAEETFERRSLPGEEWTHLKLYTSVGQQDDIVVGPLAELVAQLRADDLIDRWFFIRYADPQPHLRLRFRAASEASEAVLLRTAAWARGLVRSSLARDFTFATYDKELERYGGPSAIEAVEAVFHANSEVTTELLRHSLGNDVHTAEVCTVFALHALTRDWGLDLPSFLAGRRSGTIPDPVRRRFRDLRKTLLDLFDGPSPLDAVVSRQAETLHTAGELIRKLAADGRLAGSEEIVVGSLLHMQANRMLGLDPAREDAAQQLWQLTLRALDGRRAATGVTR